MSEDNRASSEVSVTENTYTKYNILHPHDSVPSSYSAMDCTDM